MTRDYYDVLGVKSSASDAEIRAAYKRLARKHHPDMNSGSKSAEESFKDISEAYQVLGDPQKRRQYDALRAMGGSSRGFGYGPGGPSGPHAGRGASGGFGPGGVDFSSFGFEDLGGIFSDLFGRGSPGSAGPRRGIDLEYEASIDFDEAVRGTTITIPLARNVTCPTCEGTGVVGGSGRSSGGTACRRCGGEGTVRSSDTIHARIPAGAEDGSKVRVAGAGEAGRMGGPPGDLYVVMRVRPHRYFRREGDDILLDVPLSFAEAALGAKVSVPTLSGHSTLTVPAGTRSGQRFRLRGKGVPAREGRGQGDQIVVVAIVPPRKLEARTRDLLKELDRLDNGDPRRDLDW
jgi:molecular chaperone DnaJ